MAALVFFMQLVISLGVSAGVFCLMGINGYAVVAMIITAAVLVAMIDWPIAKRIEWLPRVTLALYLGSVWPSLPVILWYGAAKGDSRDPRPSDPPQR